MKKQRVIANALHKGEFEIVPHEGPGALTEIPVNGSKKGFIHLPQIDGKVITKDTLDSLKAHEYGHIVMAERGILPLSFINDMNEAGASQNLTQTCMDAAVNAFIGPRCANLPFETAKMSPKKFQDLYKKSTVEMKTSMLLQHTGVYQSAYEYNYYTNPKPLLNKTSKKIKASIKKMSKIVFEESGNNRILTDINALVNYCVHSLSYRSSHFDYKTYLDMCKRLIETVQQISEMKDAQNEFNEKVEEEYEFENANKMVWGDIEFDEAKMDMSISRTFKEKHRPHFLGSLRYMHRSITDMKVWSLRDKSIPPIVMLIDCSGSMHLTSKTIESVMSENPASVVAGYSGRESKGGVYILGKNGKYATTDAIESMRNKYGYGNIVDGPALEWLIKQKGRLIWICDGRLTGAFEKYNDSMYHFSKHLVEKFNIEYYKSVYAFENGNRTNFSV